MGYATDEPRGTLVLSVEIVLPSTCDVWKTINNGWASTAQNVMEFNCTQKEARDITELFKTRNANMKTKATWTGIQEL